MTNKYFDQVYDFCLTASRGRRTPAKFAIPHLRVTLGPGGQVVKLMPNNPADGQPARVEIQDVDESIKCDPQSEEITRFPGPLVKLVLTFYRDYMMQYRKELKCQMHLVPAIFVSRLVFLIFQTRNSQERCASFLSEESKRMHGKF